MLALRVKEPVLLALFALGVVAATVVLFSLARERTLARTESQAAAQLDALADSAASFRASLETYTSARSSQTDWFARMIPLVERLQTSGSGLDATLTGVALVSRATLAEALQQVTEAMEGARANYDADRALMAVDALESNGRPAAEALVAGVGALRTASSTELQQLRDRWRGRAGAALAVWAGAWTWGLLWLRGRVGAAESEREVFVRAQRAQEERLRALEEDARARPLAPTARRDPSPELDAGAMADLCSAVAMMETADELPALLGRVAHALGASGIVLWVRAGDALVVGAAHGYPAGFADRVGRVAMADDNLITRVWRSGEAQTAPAAPGRPGALAAPLLRSQRTAGVLAAEVPAGAEADPHLQGLARLVAAQLSTVLNLGSDTTDSQAGDPAEEPPATLEAAI